MALAKCPSPSRAAHFDLNVFFLWTDGKDIKRTSAPLCVLSAKNNESLGLIAIFLRFAVQCLCRCF